MKVEIKNFFLLADASPADTENNDAGVHHHASISFARIVRSRGQRLIVKADAATTTAILLTSAEYYQPTVVEKENPNSLQFLHVFPPILHRESQDCAEARWLTAGLQGDSDHKSSELEITLSHLASCANAVDSREERSREARFQFEPEDLNGVFRRFPPSLIVTLGSSIEIQEFLRVALTFKLASKARWFFDGQGDFSVQEDPLRLESVLADRALEFRWDRSLLWEGRDKDESGDVDFQIQCAEKEAKLHVAFELLVSRELRLQ